MHRTRAFTNGCGRRGRNNIEDHLASQAKSHIRPVVGPKEKTMHILWWIIVGLVAGFLTGKIMKGAGYGVIGDIILGVLGAIVGGFIMRSIGFAGQGGLIYTILVAVGGAVLLTAVVRAVKRV
jgi:uncharacterized membrane protein YeaQ/YmgE (transglycosylase-associated protein family)